MSFDFLVNSQVASSGFETEIHEFFLCVISKARRGFKESRSKTLKQKSGSIKKFLK